MKLEIIFQTEGKGSSTEPKGHMQQIGEYPPGISLNHH